jgi:hypothetical protein
LLERRVRLGDGMCGLLWGELVEARQDGFSRGINGLERHSRIT